MSARILLSWSSGKDSAWALHKLRGNPDDEVIGLLTTFNEEADRVAMHAVRRSLVEAQAAATGLPLWRADLPYPCSHERYVAIMGSVISQARLAGVTHIAFGDLFLDDIRSYRESLLADSGIAPLFPLWGTAQDTAALADDMINGGLRAVITCVDSRQLPEAFAGRPYDRGLLADLPASVDPCGENGEFHTYCYAGPMFRAAVPIEVGESVTREGFRYTDILPLF